MQDPYKTLGVTGNATLDEIKNAYRALAKKYHPDLNPGNKKAEERFKEISQAYSLIGTPEERAKYDRGEFPADAEQQQQHRGPFYYQTQGNGPDDESRYSFSFDEGAGAEDIFASIFGGRMGGRRSQRNRPVQSMEIDLKDAILGATKEIRLPSGKRIQVKIPPGVTDGAKLRLGDDYIEIHIRPDPRFQRQGDDFTLELPVSITDAVFGGELRVPTVDGEVLLRIPEGSNTGTRLKLRGKGAFNRASGRRGDQFVVLKVVLPRVIDPELKEALKKWQARKKAA